MATEPAAVAQPVAPVPVAAPPPTPAPTATPAAAPAPAPPPAPAPTPVDHLVHHVGGGHPITFVLVLVAVVVACAFGYYAWKHHTGEGSSASASDTSAATAAVHAKAAAEHAQAVAQVPTLSPRAQRKIATLKAGCERMYGTRGTCTVDPTTFDIKLTCTDKHYGINCKDVCTSSSSQPWEYTPGTEAGGADPATCECEADKYHFENTDVDNNGCKKLSSAADSSSGCATGWYGEMCDKQGDYLDCDNSGTQAGAACVCPSGYSGKVCQFDTKKCTGSATDASRPYDANAVVANPESDGSDVECSCSPGYMGDHCDKCDKASGYAQSTNANGTVTCEQQPVCEIVVQSESAGDVQITPQMSQLCTDGSKNCPPHTTKWLPDHRRQAHQDAAHVGHGGVHGALRAHASGGWLAMLHDGRAARVAFTGGDDGLAKHGWAHVEVKDVAGHWPGPHEQHRVADGARRRDTHIYVAAAL